MAQAVIFVYYTIMSKDTSGNKDLKFQRLSQDICPSTGEHCGALAAMNARQATVAPSLQERLGINIDAEAALTVAHVQAADEYMSFVREDSRKIQKALGGDCTRKCVLK